MLDPKNCRFGGENHESFTRKKGRKTIEMVQYDYRNDIGELFSCVAKTLEQARVKRDKWLDKRTYENRVLTPTCRYNTM